MQAPLAQLVEQIPFKDKVTGSNPVRGTSTDSHNLTRTPKFVVKFDFFFYTNFSFLQSL